jgi:hypothetical protein
MLVGRDDDVSYWWRKEISKGKTEADPCGMTTKRTTARTTATATAKAKYGGSSLRSE